MIKILKKSAGSVRFWFYKQKTEKTELNRTGSVLKKYYKSPLFLTLAFPILLHPRNRPPFPKALTSHNSQISISHTLGLIKIEFSITL
jgi:hypothetical protein